MPFALKGGGGFQLGREEGPVSSHRNEGWDETLSGDLLMSSLYEFYDLPLDSACLVCLQCLIARQAEVVVASVVWFYGASQIT